MIVLYSYHKIEDNNIVYQQKHIHVVKDTYNHGKTTEHKTHVEFARHLCKHIEIVKSFVEQVLFQA